MPKHLGVKEDCNVVYIIKRICLVLYLNIAARLLGVCLLLIWVPPSRRIGQYRPHGPFVRFDLARTGVHSLSFRSVSTLCSVTSADGKGILPIIKIVQCVKHRAAFPISDSDVAQVPFH